MKWPLLSICPAPRGRLLLYSHKSFRGKYINYSVSLHTHCFLFSNHYLWKIKKLKKKKTVQKCVFPDEQFHIGMSRHWWMLLMENSVSLSVMSFDPESRRHHCNATTQIHGLSWSGISSRKSPQHCSALLHIQFISWLWRHAGALMTLLYVCIGEHVFVWPFKTFKSV